MQDSNTALLKACLEGHLDVAKVFLKSKDIKINKSDKSGTTPLFAAVSNNSHEMAKLLIVNGALLNVTRVSSYCSCTTLIFILLKVNK